MSNFVQNATQRVVEAGNAIDVRTSLPAKTGVAGVTGGLFTFASGVLAAADNQSTDVWVAFNLPGEKTSFEIDESVNVSQNGIFRLKVKDGETIEVGDKLMVDPADNSQVVKYVAATDVVSFATARYIESGVVVVELLG